MSLPDWSRLVDATGDAPRARRQLEALASEAPGPLASVGLEAAPLLVTALAASSWIGERLRRRPESMGAIFRMPDLQRPRTGRELRDSAAGACNGPDDALEALRRFHAIEHLRIGVRDLGRLGTMEEITAELSDLADACLGQVLRIVTASHEQRFGRAWHRGSDGRWQPTAFTVMGLGKLGGRELNFSSDVDLLLVYEEEGEVMRSVPRPRARTPAGAGPAHEYFRRLSADFATEVGRITPEGQLYRVDLRLRPEGDAGPLARSLPGYEAYYAQWGQTWERLMLLKARPVAGDPGLGGEFLDLIQPFRYPRFPAEHLPDEIAASKARVERETVEGDAARDVKRGRGGIREIEFIVQAFQLLHGGRLPFLQTASTLTALAKLAEYGLLDAARTGELAAAYGFWRDVEHRLQMEGNLQTHALPVDPAARERIAWLVGCRTVGEFEALREGHADRVRAAFNQLLAGRGRAEPAGPELPGDFSAAADAWEELLGRHGFANPPQARRLIQSLVEGPGWAHVSARTGRLGRMLIARLLGECPGSPFPAGPGGPPDGRLSDPDRVVARLDRFVAAYGSRAPLYETWIGNPRFFSLLVWLFDRSEFLAETAIRVPDLVEDMVRTDRLRRPRTSDETRADLRHGAGDPDQRLWLRRYQEAEQMRIGLRSVVEIDGAGVCARELSRLADACIAHALEVLRRRHRLRHPPFSVFALGRLGGEEMAFGSDLDLLLVAPPRGGHPDRLPALAAGLVDLLGGMTDLGKAYDVDLRLRPDGEAGPLVIPPDVLEGYYRDRASLWEIQALTRLRFIAGSERIGTKLGSLADSLTDFRRGNPGVAAWRPDWLPEMGRMLGRIHRERTPPGRDANAFKTGVGGLVDAEFVAQSWCLAGGWRVANTAAALRRGLDEGRLPAGLGRDLTDAHAELGRIELIVRRWSGAAESELPTEPSARRRVAIRCGHRSAGELETAMAGARRTIARAAQAAGLIPPP